MINSAPKRAQACIKYSVRQQTRKLSSNNFLGTDKHGLFSVLLQKSLTNNQKQPRNAWLILSYKFLSSYHLSGHESCLAESLIAGVGHLLEASCLSSDMPKALM